MRAVAARASRPVKDEPRCSRSRCPGGDLSLTLDMELMRTLERAFRGHPSGCGRVVVDVNDRQGARAVLQARLRPQRDQAAAQRASARAS